MTKKIILLVIMLVFFSVLVSNSANAYVCICDTLITAAPGNPKYCMGVDCGDKDGISCTSASDCEECTCTGWTDQGCGEGDCPSDWMYSTRTCTPPPGCKFETTCAPDTSCEEDTTTSTTTSCFLTGTPVALPDGTEKPIEDVRVGDIVLSYDEKTQTNVPSIVKKTFYHPKEQSNSYLIINNRLRVTPNHPILVNGRWQEIGNANIGNVLRLRNGNNLIITSIRIVYDKIPTYNFEVEDTHTYYAGDVLVHNGWGGTGTGKGVTTTTTPTTTPTTVYTTIYTTSTTADPCAGVNCGSCRYCSGGNCYNYCPGTSSSCGCTSCTNCGSCAYCSNYNCYNYCSGTDTSCGCTSCTNCNSKDGCYNEYYRDYYCSGTSCKYSSKLDNSCSGLAADVAAVSNLYLGEIPVVLLNISNPYSLASGKLTLSVRDEDNNLIGSCSQTISLSNKLFFGTSVKNAHFYSLAEPVLLTNEEIYECKQSSMSTYMYDECTYHSCTDETYYNYAEDDFYKKYSGLKILENTLNYLPSSDFVKVDMPSCELLFRSLALGFYNLTASLEVTP
ncbi:MAG: hypothetical protein KKE93_04920 [Nanoarchaeota archaeon]|nr:hypothetical protein [Nanoarchaeota archaeon]